MATVELGDLVTITNVPLLEVGQEYPASTGPFTATQAMLEECVASQQDPHIPAPRLKLGHWENSIDADLQELWEQAMEDRPANDSEPAVGTIQNMHMSSDGMVMLGDLVGIPEWLAAILTTAYPARSVEGGAWKNDANQKTWDFCIQALALLGVAWPGCTSLEDLQALFSKDGPDQVLVIEMASAHGVAPKKQGGKPMPVTAQVDIEGVRRAFYEDVAVDDRFWWWDRQLLIEPNEMIASDPDSGQLYRIPFTVSGDEVSWSDPVPVKIVYEDQPDKADGVKASVGLAVLPNAGKVIASNKTKAEAHSGFRSEDDKEDQMDPKQIRERLGLPEDATDEEVFAKLDEAKEPVAPPEPETESDDTDSNNPGGGAEPGVTERPATAEVPEPVAAAAKGVKVLDEETYNRLMAGAQTAEKLAAEQRTGQRDMAIKAAIDDGRIPPARKSHWEQQFAADYDGALATLNSLTPGTIPMSERGTGQTPEALEADGGPGYDPAWLSPAERDRVKAAADGTLRSPRIMVEA